MGLLKKQTKKHPPTKNSGILSDLVIDCQRHRELNKYKKNYTVNKGNVLYLRIINYTLEFYNTLCFKTISLFKSMNICIQCTKVIPNVMKIYFQLLFDFMFRDLSLTISPLSPHDYFKCYLAAPWSYNIPLYNLTFA